MKELAKEFKKQFTCLWENTKKYIIFTVPIEKEVARTDKNRENITKNISYILQFIDTAHYQILSILCLKEFRELNVNIGTMIKNVKHVELNIGIATALLNIQMLNMI